MRRGCCESRGLLMPFKQGSTKDQSIQPKLKLSHLWPSIAAFKVQSHQFVQICNNVFLRRGCCESWGLLMPFHIRPIWILFQPNVWLWIRPKQYIDEDHTIHRLLFHLFNTDDQKRRFKVYLIIKNLQENQLTQVWLSFSYMTGFLKIQNLIK